VGIFRNRRTRGTGKRINLALQGGGAHGAFTWGVLDRVLEDGRLGFDGVSGTSAGALNAVALAAGLAEGGFDGARSKLEQLWRAVSVQLNPTHDTEVPTTAPDILARLSTIVFNAPIRREMEMFGFARAIAAEGFARRGAMTSRLKRHRFHHEAARITAKLGPVSKLQPDWELLCYLRDCGRTMAGAWLRTHYEAVGRRSTAGLGGKL
jgi:predicted acylesterase/phospholipase RssA